MMNRAAKTGSEVVTSVLDGPTGANRPLVSLTSGYLKRAQAVVPKTFEERPWKNHENYIADITMSIRCGSMKNGVLQFSAS